MTFKDYIKNGKVEEIKIILHEYSLGDYKLDEWDIINLMEESYLEGFSEGESRGYETRSS
jgi:hypothetical protein